MQVTYPGRSEEEQAGCPSFKSLLSFSVVSLLWDFWLFILGMTVAEVPFSGSEFTCLDIYRVIFCLSPDSQSLWAWGLGFRL